MRTNEIQVGETYYYKEGKWGIGRYVRALDVGVRFNARNPHSGVRVAVLVHGDDGELTATLREEIVLSRWIIRTKAEQDQRNERIREENQQRDAWIAQQRAGAAANAWLLHRELVKRAVPKQPRRVRLQDVAALTRAGFAVSTAERPDLRGPWVMSALDVTDAMDGKVSMEIVALLLEGSRS